MNNNSAPAISVIIPTYNRKDALCLAIDSVLSCTSIKVEIIVVDDGSNDGTLEIIPNKYPSTVRLISNNHSKGPAGARNSGVAAANSNFIAFLDDDDEFLSGHLDSSLNILTEHDEIGFVFGKARYINENNECLTFIGEEQQQAIEKLSYKTLSNCNFLNDELFDELIDRECFLNTSTVVMKKDIFNEAGGFIEDLWFGEDWELWMRISKITRSVYLNNEQVNYLIHSDNISLQDNPKAKITNKKNVDIVWQKVFAYPGLSTHQTSRVKSAIAKNAFECGYENLKLGNNRFAIQWYFKSLRYKASMRVLLALIKLPFSILFVSSHGVSK